MIVLITGVTSGFGMSCAKLFSKKGYKIILVGRRKDRLQKLSKELGNPFRIRLAIIGNGISQLSCLRYSARLYNASIFVDTFIRAIIRINDFINITSYLL